MIVKVVSMSFWEMCRQHNIMGLVWDKQSIPREEEQTCIILTIKCIFPKHKQKGHILFSHLLFQKSGKKSRKTFEALGSCFFFFPYILFHFRQAK